MPHILQSSAKKLKVKNTELFKTKDFMEKFFHSMNILDFPATIAKAKGKFQAFRCENKIYKKTGKRFTVIKKLHLKYND